MTDRPAVLREVAAMLRGRADSLERSGNTHGAFEARNCATAVDRMDADSVRQLYRAGVSIRHIANRTGVAHSAVREMVEDLMPEHSRSRCKAWFLERNWRRSSTNGYSWRCACGCLAQGETCHRGHPAPWKEEG